MAIRFRKDIQGLRALAVLLVIVFHSNIETFSGGYVGVDVFFVISGYLITGLLLKELKDTQGIQFKSFYSKRIKRILPLSLVVTVTTLLLFSFILSPLETKELSKTGLMASVFSSNLWFSYLATSYFFSENHLNPLLHTWSLGVEEQFYLLWPAVLFLFVQAFGFRKVKFLIVTLIIISMFIFLTQFSHNVPQTFFSPHTRAWQFGFGALIHFLPQLKADYRYASSAGVGTGLTLIVLTSLLIGPEFNSFAAYAIPPTLGAMMVIYFGEKNNAFSNILACRPLEFIGKISFSLYLWHWPVLVFFQFSNPSLSSSNLFLAYSIIALLSIGSFYFIEETFRHNSIIKKERTALFAGLLIVAAGCFASFGLYAFSKFELNSPGQRKIESVEFGGVNTGNCISKIEESELVVCEKGDVKSERTLVLFGDSKAQQWIPELSNIAATRGWRLLTVVKAGCPPVLMDVYLSFLGREYKECASWKVEALKHIKLESPDVIVMTHFGGYAPMINGNKVKGTYDIWQKGINNLFERFSTFSPTVLYIPDNPMFPVDIPTCLSRKVGGDINIQADICGFSLSDMNSHHNVKKAINNIPFDNVIVMDLIENYCPNNFCPAVSNGEVRYSDHHHLSKQYMKEISPLIDEKLVRIFSNLPQ